MIFNVNAFEFVKTEEFKNIVANKQLCIVTDPPFNIGYHYDGYKDRMNEEEYYRNLCDLITACNCPFVIVHYPEQLYRLSATIGKYPTKVISWVYNSNTAKQHRDIAYFGVKPNMNQVKQPYKNPTDKRIRERIARGIEGGRLYDWWNINQVKNVSKKDINHPCVMPLEVMKNAVGILPREYTILDPFMGSGTTGIACKEYEMDFIGMELVKEYFELAKNRLQK